MKYPISHFLSSYGLCPGLYFYAVVALEDDADPVVNLTGSIESRPNGGVPPARYSSKRSHILPICSPMRYS